MEARIVLEITVMDESSGSAGERLLNGHWLSRNAYYRGRIPRRSEGESVSCLRGRPPSEIPRTKFLIGLLFSAAALAGPGAPPSAASPEIRWQAWSDYVFARAKAEKRLVLLDLDAVWCHWCHVMEETTYADPAVVRR